jgi:enediyne biosynthesis protein E4
LINNGHVYPEVRDSDSEFGYPQRKVLYRNLRNGRFADVSLDGGPGIVERAPGCGCAFGDFGNDGDIDVLVNCVNSGPQLLRCDQSGKTNWLTSKTVGVKSNRCGIGTRIYCQTGGGHRQMDEVRSGGSFVSQNDLRIHFDLGPAAKANASFVDMARHRRYTSERN